MKGCDILSYSVKNEYKYEKYNNETINHYIDDRLLAQIDWYDSKSITYQKMYKRLTIVSTILSATIPIFTLALDFECEIIFKFIIAIISSIISIISSILAINKYKELWVQYRTNCELLKSILHRYYTHTGEFSLNNNNNFETLVLSCESYFTKEFNSWSNIYNNQASSSTGS